MKHFLLVSQYTYVAYNATFIEKIFWRVSIISSKVKRIWEEDIFEAKRWIQSLFLNGRAQEDRTQVISACAAAWSNAPGETGWEAGEAREAADGAGTGGCRIPATSGPGLAGLRGCRGQVRLHRPRNWPARTHHRNGPLAWSQVCARFFVFRYSEGQPQTNKVRRGRDH